MTLYTIMDYLHAKGPTTLSGTGFLLTEAQLDAALTYIATHQEEVEAEYQTVLRQVEENRAYWEAHNRERLAHIATLPPPPGREALYAKIQAQKAGLENPHSVFIACLMLYAKIQAQKAGLGVE